MPQDDALLRRVDAAIDARFDEALELLEQLVAINSITPDYYATERASVIGGESACARRFGAWMAQAGYEVHEVAPDPERVNTVARRPGAGKGRSLLLNGHVDTVAPFRPERWSTGNPWQPRREGDRLYGLGACDMKGGLVTAGLAARALADAGVELAGELQIHAVVGEETGGKDLGTLAPLCAGFTADAAIVVEPSSGRDLLTVAPVSYGLLAFDLTVTGIGTHVGNRARAIRPGGPGAAAGVNAVEKAIQIVTALQKLEQDWGVTKTHPGFQPGAFTITPSWFHGDCGLPSAGFFADHAEVKYIVWYPPHEDPAAIRAEIEAQIHHAAQLDPWLRDNPPGIEWQIDWPGLTTAPEHPLVQTLLQRRREVLGDQAATHRAGAFEAAADATWIAQMGIPVAIFGPGNLGQAHAIDEYISLSEMRQAARILARVILDWCGNPTS